jgi:hypothetical protein
MVTGLRPGQSLFAAGARGFFSFRVVQIASGVHRILWAAGLFPGVKRPELDTEYSVTSRAEVNSGWSLASVP